MKALRLAATACVMIVLTAGCATGTTRLAGGASGQPAGVTASTGSHGHSLLNGQLVQLPLDAYTADSAQSNAITQATNELIAACMHAKGFTVPPPTKEQLALQASSSQLDEPYGITSMTQAAKYGYSSPVPVSATQAHPQPVKSFGPGTDGPKESPAYYTALVGYPSGIPPPGYDTVKGCTGQAYDDLDGGPAPVDPHDVLGSLGGEAEQETEGSSAVVAVLAAWSKCMAAKGFTYQTPMQAATVQWPEAPSPLEISTARADVSCKQQTHVPLIWQETEAHWQEVLIQQNYAALQQVKQATAAEISRAEKVLARSR